MAIEITLLILVKMKSFLLKKHLFELKKNICLKNIK